MLINTNLSAQIGPQQIVSNIGQGYPDLITADLDGDSDMDIITAGNLDIVWFENINGLGLYGDRQVIVSIPFERASSVSAVDLDGDGDLDILSCFNGEFPGISKVAWNENLDGLGNFGPQIIINDNVFAIFTVLGADIDGDSDIDVFTIERNNGKISWYENLDGSGNFGSQNIISNALDWPIHGVLADLDNDGDIDIVSHAYDGNKIVWFENLDGLGTYSNHIIISSDVNRPITVFCADIDMDGDLDIISTSLMDNKIAWYENMNGDGDFSSQILITTDVINPRNVFVQDLDNDGDQDILSSFRDNGNSGVIWCENLDGNGNFTPPILISDEVDYVTSVYASDLDQDQDFDILSVSHFDSKTAWYENLSLLNSSDFKQTKNILYPNPVENILSIESDENIELIKVFDQTGKLMFYNTALKEIDLTVFPGGLYMIQIIYQNNEIEYHKIIKE